MPTAAHIDFEGGAPGDLLKQGVYRWIEHPAAQCWVLGWRFDQDPVQQWRPGDPDPVPLLDWVHRGGRVVAHNAAGFEYPYWNWFIRRKYCPHWPRLEIAQLDCTMARAFAVGLPGALDNLSAFLGGMGKDKEGYKVMRQMAGPRSIKPCTICRGSGCEGCDWSGQVYTWWDTPDRVEKLLRYNATDVVEESWVDELVPALSATEREMWEFDCRMNERGIRLDMPLIEKAIEVTNAAQADLDAEMAQITGSAVTKCTQTKRLVTWVNARGVPCESVGKGSQEDIIILADHFDAPDVVRAIELRQLSKGSLSKLKRMQDCVSADGRARNLIQYHAAHTGRAGGRLIQPHNLYRVDEEIDGLRCDYAIEALETLPAPAAREMIGHIAGQPTEIIAKCMRRFFIADPGKRLIGGDLSNIEGCVNAWLPDETWKVEAFRAYQRGDGPDLYCVTYAGSFGGDPASVRGRRRQVGKVMELAYGYEGGVFAFISMGAVYRVKPREVVNVVREITEENTWIAACDLYQRSPVNRRYDLPMDEWVAVKITVNRYRDAHPNLRQGWRDQQDAAISAVAAPGNIYDCFNNRIAYLVTANFLWCRLPTGRILAYPKPRLVTQDTSYLELPGGQRFEIDEIAPWEWDMYSSVPGAKVVERRKQVVIYEGRASRGGQSIWGTQSLYGGKQDENNVSGIARDVLFTNLKIADKRGYCFVLHVHDEGVTEMPYGQGSKEELKALLELPVPGTEGLPLQAKTWEDVRYSK